MASNGNQAETVSDLYPRQWLTAEDVEGRRVRVTVAGYQVREFRRPSGETEAAVVLAFTAAGKPCARRLICNRTQARALAELMGSERFADWIGHEVTLCAARAQNGKATIAIVNAEGQ